MLSEKTIDDIKARIDKINKKLKEEAEQTLSNGKSYEEMLHQLTEHAVREFAPESKMLMDSVYNVLSKETLQTEFFQVTARETAFHKKNIQKDIASHFSFEVPEKMDFKKDSSELLTSSGIVVIGGLVSIGIKSLIPISIAAVLAYIMYEAIAQHKKENQSQLIDQYLISIRGTLIRWLENIAEYYDQQVEALKVELVQQEV